MRSTRLDLFSSTRPRLGLRAIYCYYFRLGLAQPRSSPAPGLRALLAYSLLRSHVAYFFCAAHLQLTFDRLLKGSTRFDVTEVTLGPPAPWISN